MIFGCRYFVANNDKENLEKIDSKVDETIFLSYSLILHCISTNNTTSTITPLQPLSSLSFIEIKIRFPPSNSFEINIILKYLISLSWDWDKFSSDALFFDIVTIYICYSIIIIYLPKFVSLYTSFQLLGFLGGFNFLIREWISITSCCTILVARNSIQSLN